MSVQGKEMKRVFDMKLRLAGKNIFVTTIYESTVRFCSDYIVDFDEADVNISMTREDIEAERIRSAKQAETDKSVAKNPSSAYLETLALYRKIAEALVEFNIVLFHGSAVSLDGEVYLFTAKSGTGKSTHTRLWRELFGDRVVMINDDKPLLEITESGVTVYGTPWDGKHRLSTNASAPLKAICILERSEKNTISRQEPISTYVSVLSQTYKLTEPDAARKMLALVDKIIKTIPIYKLGCNMEREAAKVSCAGMGGKVDKNEA